MSLKQLSKTIVAARKKKGWSQTEAAKYAGMSLNTYRRIEEGFTDEVGITKVDDVIDLFGLEIALREKERPLTLEELQRGETY